MMNEEKPKGLKRIVMQPSQNGCLLLDRSSDQIHSLNKTAAFIWTFCDGRHGVSEIEDALKTHWAGNPDDVREEIHKTLRQFKSLGLLEQ